jgi:basic membrane protein A and related proteins
MKLRSSSVVLLLMTALLLAACGDDSENGSAGSGGGSGGSAEPAAARKDIKTVGLALAGARNDRSFYQSHFDGAEEARKEIGFELKVVDNLEEPQAQIEGFRNLARAGNDVVIGAGGVFYQAADAAAAEHPDTYFIVTQGATTKFYENVTSISPDQAIPAYAAGVAMAKQSKSGVIGVLGGLEIPPTVQNYKGIKLGAEATDPDIKVLNTVVGSFNDAAKARTAAEAQIADGADVIFAFLDSAYAGVLKAAEGTDVALLGPIIPRCDLSEQYMGTTISNNVKLVSNALRDLSEGKLEPGARYYGVEDPTVQTFELCPNFETPELTGPVEQTLEDLESGKVKLPADALHARPEYYEGP